MSHFSTSFAVFSRPLDVDSGMAIVCKRAVLGEMVEKTSKNEFEMRVGVFFSYPESKT